MKSIDTITERIIEFRNNRDWKQFHNPKDVAISLSIEASELLEHFQWKSDLEVKEYIKNNKTEISKELADVFYWVLLMSHDLEIDISNAIEEKMQENEIKYPVDKSKGKHTKYNKL